MSAERCMYEMYVMHLLRTQSPKGVSWWQTMDGLYEVELEDPGFIARDRTLLAAALQALAFMKQPAPVWPTEPQVQARIEALQHTPVAALRTTELFELFSVWNHLRADLAASRDLSPEEAQRIAEGVGE